MAFRFKRRKFFRRRFGGFGFRRRYGRFGRIGRKIAKGRRKARRISKTARKQGSVTYKRFILLAPLADFVSIDAGKFWYGNTNMYLENGSTTPLTMASFVPDFTPYAAMFDMYKIVKVVTKFIPTGNTDPPPIYMVRRKNVSGNAAITTCSIAGGVTSQTNWDNFNDDDTAKHRWISNFPMKPFKIVTRPQFQGVMADGLIEPQQVGTGTIFPTTPKKMPWISTLQTSMSFIGEDFGMFNAGTAAEGHTWNLEYKFYVKFRNRYI